MMQALGDRDGAALGRVLADHLRHKRDTVLALMRAGQLHGPGQRRRGAPVRLTAMKIDPPATLRAPLGTVPHPTKPAPSWSGAEARDPRGP
jgi:hypothetical protein